MSVTPLTSHAEIFALNEPWLLNSLFISFTRLVSHCEMGRLPAVPQSTESLLQSQLPVAFAAKQLSTATFKASRSTIAPSTNDVSNSSIHVAVAKSMFFWHRTLALGLPSRVSRSLGEYPNKTSIVFKTRWGANEPLCPLVLRAIFNETLRPPRQCMPSGVANACCAARYVANGAVPPVCTPCDAYAGIAPSARRSPGCATVALKGPNGGDARWKRTSSAQGCTSARSSSKGTT